MARLQEAHNEEMEEVMRRSQQEKHDSLSMMQSSITAEKQVNTHIYFQEQILWCLLFWIVFRQMING